MSPLKSKKLGFSAAAIVVLGLALSQGCSSSDDSQATPTAGTNSGGTSSHGGSAGNGGSSAAGKGGAATGGTTTTGGTGGVAGSPDMGTAGEGGAVDCNGPDGCYNCAPSTTTQFLNHCVAGGCQPAQDFHLPATLPALP